MCTLLRNFTLVLRACPSFMISSIIYCIIHFRPDKSTTIRQIHMTSQQENFLSMGALPNIAIKLMAWPWHGSCIFEPTCAYARWALMRCFLYVCLDGCDLTIIHLTKIHISSTVKVRVMKFGQI